MRASREAQPFYISGNGETQTGRRFRVAGPWPKQRRHLPHVTQQERGHSAVHFSPALSTGAIRQGLSAPRWLTAAFYQKSTTSGWCNRGSKGHRPNSHRLLHWAFLSRPCAGLAPPSWAHTHDGADVGLEGLSGSRMSIRAFPGVTQCGRSPLTTWSAVVTAVCHSQN